MRSSDFGIYISGEGTFNAPEREIETVDVPGRNGSLTVDNHRFKNISIRYPAFIQKNFRQNVNKAKAWLLSCVGYQRLTDSYHTDFYRMARFVGPLDFETRFLNYSGEMELVFDCMPQRFYCFGEQPVIIEKDTVLNNPSFYEALPLITIYGNAPGTLSIGGISISILELNGYITIDCDTQNAYKDFQNKNTAISAPVFPSLGAGETTIHFDGGITRVEIIPRWWTV